MRDDAAIVDGDLLRRARGGDGVAYGEFYRRYRVVLLAFLRRRGCSSEVAADLTAETFAAALVVTLDRGRDLPAEPGSWLFTIALNKLRDSVRRGRVEQQARARLLLEPLAMDDEDMRRIEQLTDAADLPSLMAERLSAEQLVVLQARVVEEREYAEIARTLRCSEAVVRKRVSRALNTLRTAMEGMR
jgi:RNA polymerase sigma factor (sigma-70 family)